MRSQAICACSPLLIAWWSRLSEPRSHSTLRHYLIQQQMAVTTCRVNALYGKIKQKRRFARCDIIPEQIICQTQVVALLTATILFALWKCWSSAHHRLPRTCSESVRCGVRAVQNAWFTLVSDSTKCESVLWNIVSRHCFPAAKSNWKQAVMQNRQFKQVSSGRLEAQAGQLHVSACAASRAQAPIHIYLWPGWHS